MNQHHEIAMLAAQMWGEANAEGAEPEGFGVDVACAYCGADWAMESETGLSAPDGVEIDPAAQAGALLDILTKRAK